MWLRQLQQWHNCHVMVVLVTWLKISADLGGPLLFTVQLYQTLSRVWGKRWRKLKANQASTLKFPKTCFCLQLYNNQFTMQLSLTLDSDRLWYSKLLLQAWE